MTLKTDVHRIDTVIDDMSDPSESQCELLREHLETARNYLLGAMPVEYELSLQLATQALDCITDKDRRRRVESAIAEMLAEK